jgi:hypothetical protein
LVAFCLAGAGLMGAHPARAQTLDPPLPPPAHGDPNQALQQFTASTRRGVWPNISKTTLLSEIKARLQNPYRVDQGSQPFCGPAALLFELVRCNPAAYVRYCRSLFEEGRFGERHVRYEAAEYLRRNVVPRGISQVDWMMMATLKEGGWWDGTPETPIKMQEWIQELIGYDHVRRFSTRQPTLDSRQLSGKDALYQGDIAVTVGGIAMMLVDADFINNKWDAPYQPNHWIVLLGDVWYNWGYVGFHFYTWAHWWWCWMYEGSLQDNLFVVVTALP